MSDTELKQTNSAELDRIAFGERLKEARTTKGYTQNELSEITGISKIMISSYENPNSKSGKNPTLNNVYLLAKALDVSIDYLCDNKPPMNYADVIRFLIEYNKKCSIEVRVIDISRYYGCSEEVPFINFSCEMFYKFLVEWDKMRKLLDDGTINEKLYTLWINDQIANYSLVPVKEVKKKSAKTKSKTELKDIEDDNDLPF